MSGLVCNKVRRDAKKATELWRSKRPVSRLGIIREIITHYESADTAYIAGFVALADPDFVDWLERGMPVEGES